MNLLNLDEYEAAAREVLSQMAFDYIAGGADDEVTIRENRAAFARLRLRPRVLAGVGTRDLQVTVLGQPIAFPVMVAPVAFHQLATPEGECATARAAGEAGTIMCVSTAANYSLEDVATVAGGPLWFQLYCYKDRAITRALVERAAAAGYRALVLTADTPVIGRRERDIRNRFTLPPGMGWKNAETFGKRDLPQDAAGSGLAAYIATQQESDLTWADLDWLVSISPMPVLVKGVMTAEDTVLAAEHGATGVVVSNHGGRQLDTALASIDALPQVVAAAAPAGLTVLLDGGVRRGTDVLKALALGARAVLVGRPVIWGLAVDGEAGARAVLDTLRAELDIALALAGCARAADLHPGFVVGQ
ncbi:MAG TPA: alpha-hydroxy acid oxidase [Chloroflexia bacterium]|nr:alpha-hydroxy acid oxidase [Chloroflexia bacterium]